MKDYLNEYCESSNIKLIYTKNSVTVLSGTVKENIPVIRVHSLFKECPEYIANAVIKYYTGSENKSDYLEIVEDYLSEQLPFQTYKIIPPDPYFKSMPKQPEEKTRSNSDADPSLLEAGIASIIQKDFWGNSAAINPDDPITASSDGVVELDITLEGTN